MIHENDTRNIGKHGRRSADNINTEKDLSSSSYHFRSRLFTGFIAIGGVTALLAIGRASNTLDSVVADTANNTRVITEMLITQTELMGSIKENTNFMNRFFQQQKDSDKEFLNELRETREKLNDIDNGVRRNRESIIMINPKMSFADNTKVNQYASK